MHGAWPLLSCSTDKRQPSPSGLEQGSRNGSLFSILGNHGRSHGGSVLRGLRLAAQLLSTPLALEGWDIPGGRMALGMLLALAGGHFQVRSAAVSTADMGI